MFVVGYVTLCNFSGNLCRNKIAREAARNITLCNSAFNTKGIKLWACGLTEEQIILMNSSDGFVEHGLANPRDSSKQHTTAVLFHRL